MTRYEIKKWMLLNADRFLDKQTNELNTTLMVETWDLECASGKDTLDSDHIAWSIAVDVSEHLDK